MSDFKRNCPTCNIELIYKSKGALTTAKNASGECRKCASIRTGFTTKYGTREKGGEKNSFYGKKHTDETIIQMKEYQQNRDNSYRQSQEFKDKISKVTSGTNNPMFGKSVMEIWIEKYGEEEALRRDIIRREKWSKASSGKNNPMYGKPIPNKAGNGWSGWYKDWFFRSLRELSYVINILEKNRSIWRSCEGLFRIEYIDWAGKNRTYTPDFFVDDYIIVEIKPSRLHNSPSVLSKRKYAEEFCVKNCYQYVLTDCDIMDFTILEKLINTKEVILTDKTELKYVKFKEDNHS